MRGVKTGQKIAYYFYNMFLFIYVYKNLGKIISAPQRTAQNKKRRQFMTPLNAYFSLLQLGKFDQMNHGESGHIPNVMRYKRSCLTVM